MKIRAAVDVTVRTPVQTRSGTFDDGRSWDVREVEVVDQDMNKTMLRVLQGVDVQPGPCSVDIDIDWTNKGGKVTIVGVRALAKSHT